MKNQLIIFSKNRACQLNLLLDSIKKNSNGLFNVTNVLYTFDNDEFRIGYNILKSRYPTVNFIKENNFKEDLLILIKKEYETTTFLVDDAIIYSPIPILPQTVLNTITSDIICFSLRLGKNCSYSHPANTHYSFNNYEEKNSIIRFNWKNQEGDFNYPLSTDGHIYQTNIIKNLIMPLNFNNPNQLESSLQFKLNNIPTYMVCFKKSTVVSVPVNIVNKSFNNRNGLYFYFPEKDLNIRYNSGEIININSLDFFHINGPHKEIEYKFTKWK